MESLTESKKTQKIRKVVLLRHGESLWNKENKFTGWVDVDLSAKGLDEANAAGELLKSEGFEFDYAFTSVLKRAIRTLWITLDKLDQRWIPIEKDWRLNERHYGDLQGLNKKETAKKYGDEQVFTWRRSYATPPPVMAKTNPMHPCHDRRYSPEKTKTSEMPSAEALKQTKERFLPYWEETIWPKINSGEKVIIAAHGNSLRALIKHLDDVSDEEITKLNIPTGKPLVYEIGEDGKAVRHYYLGNADEIKAAAEKVANQAK